jgi:hypothetical protein
VISSIWLRTRIDVWHAAGDDVLSQRLLWLTLTIFVAIAAVTALTMLETSMSGDEAILLLTLPLTSAERVMIALVRVVRDRTVVFVLMNAVITSVTVSVSAPGWASVILMTAWLGLVLGSVGAIYGVCLWSTHTWSCLP